MTDRSGPDPKEFQWVVSQAQPEEPRFASGVDMTYAFTIYNLPKEGQRYADPDVRVRCYVNVMGDTSWCDVHVAWGVTAGMANPRPELFNHSKVEAIRSFEEVTGVKFPTDIRLHTQTLEWEQIGEAA